MIAHGALLPGEVSDADAASFHILRPRLFGIACRVLGRTTDADDVVQDAWIRWQRTDRSKVSDATGFLVTATTRSAMTVGQSAHARRETSIGLQFVEPFDAGADLSLGAERCQMLELAVRTLLEKLSPCADEQQCLLDAFAAAAQDGGRRNARTPARRRCRRQR